MPQRWAIDVANKLKESRDEFQGGFAALRQAGHSEDSTFVSAMSEIVDELNAALKKGAEDYGIDPN